MRLRSHPGPSPALIVAALALVVALTGTAIASPDLAGRELTQKEVKKVKKIAKKQAKKMLRKNIDGSHVNLADRATRADRADRADNADNATNATTADTAANAQALSGNTVVGEGDLDGPGALTNSSCVAVSAPAPGVQPGDHVVLTPPSGWPTYEINLTARVTANTVTYEICNQSGALANFGTSPPLRFLVFR